MVRPPIGYRPVVVGEVRIATLGFPGLSGGRLADPRLPEQWTDLFCEEPH